MKRKYSLVHLKALPTLAQGQADDLKIETLGTNGGGVRVWLSRCSNGDGEPYSNKVTIEKLIGYYKSATREQYEKQGKRGRWEFPRWVIDYTYQAK